MVSLLELPCEILDQICAILAGLPKWTEYMKCLSNTCRQLNAIVERHRKYGLLRGERIFRMTQNLELALKVKFVNLCMWDWVGLNVTRFHSKATHSTIQTYPEHPLHLQFKKWPSIFDFSLSQYHQSIGICRCLEADSEDDIFRARVVALVLLHCRRIEELHLLAAPPYHRTRHYLWHFTKAILEFTNKSEELHYPRLREVFFEVEHIHTWDDVWLVSQIPALRTLNVKGMLIARPLRPNSVESGLPSRVETLNIRMVHYDPSVLLFLIPSRFPRLTSFECGFNLPSEGRDLVQHLRNAYGETLESLVLLVNIADGDYNLGSFAMFSHLTYLQVPFNLLQHERLALTQHHICDVLPVSLRILHLRDYEPRSQFPPLGRRSRQPLKAFVLAELLGLIRQTVNKFTRLALLLVPVQMLTRRHRLKLAACCKKYGVRCYVAEKNSFWN